MKNIEFGYLLEKLLYLSKQKKSALAKALGYDVSYLSKWTSGKNLPIAKNIYDICSITSKFIVNSLTEEALNDITQYFEIEKDLTSKEELYIYFEEILKESYIYTSKKNIQVQQKNVYWDEEYNSTIHINPKLRRYYLNKDVELFMSKSHKIDLLISADLKRLGNNDKKSLADIKHDLFHKSNDIETRVRILFKLDDYEEIIFNTIMIINMIAMYPSMNFEVYNCPVDANTIISIVKDSMLYTSNFTNDKRCLISTMSKDKRIVEEIYYSLETILKNQGSRIVEEKTLEEVINGKIYTQYFMNQDLRWLIGSMNELFMPPELYIEIAKSLFDDSEILQELERVNIVLQNITYKSKVKVLIYLSEIKNYISLGKINFCNTPVELSFEQRKAHINYLKEIIMTSENIEVRLVDGGFVEYFKNYPNPSLYLSKSIKLIEKDNHNGDNGYSVIKDSEFKSLCDEFYKNLWEKEREIIISDKEEILEILEKELTYVSMLNDKLTNN